MDDQVHRLPKVYATYLALRGCGLDDARIARSLDVSVDSLPMLARLAEAKLARLRKPPGSISGDSTGHPPAPPAE